MKIIITESQHKVIMENQRVLNKILDKISYEGMDSLTFREREFLDKFSKDKAPDELGGDINYKKGATFESSMPGIPKFTFVFNEVNETADGIEYYGSFYFQGNEYIGAFVCDKDNNLESIEFSIWGDNENEPTDLLDAIEGLEHEIEVFFEDEVLPALIDE